MESLVMHPGSAHTRPSDQTRLRGGRDLTGDPLKEGVSSLMRLPFDRAGFLVCAVNTGEPPDDSQPAEIQLLGALSESPRSMPSRRSTLAVIWIIRGSNPSRCQARRASS